MQHPFHRLDRWRGWLATGCVLSLSLPLSLLLPLTAMSATGSTASATGGTGGNYFALVIGNNAYQKLPRLQTAEADARDVAALLKGTYGFNTRLLTNATRAQMLGALAAYRRELSADSNLLIYYAGHGYNEKDADKAYWLPVDATLDDMSNWIIADEITTALKVIPARHVLIVADSCYSGTLSRGIGEPQVPAGERQQFLDRMVGGHSRTLMASGGNEPVADGGGNGHSVFAAAFLRGLRDMQPARFTAAELYRGHVEERVAGSAEQTPEYNALRNSGHENGDFVFVKVVAGGANVEVSVKVTPSGAGAIAVAPTTRTIEFSDFKGELQRNAALGTGAVLSAGNLRIESTAGSNLVMPAGLRQVGFMLGVPTLPTDAPAGLYCGELSFADDASSVSLTRPGVTGGASTPAWQMQAFDARGREVGEMVGEGDIVTGSYFFPPVPQDFTITAERIHRLRVCSRNRLSTFGAIPIARIKRTVSASAGK